MDLEPIPTLLTLAVLFVMSLSPWIVLIILGALILLFFRIMFSVFSWFFKITTFKTKK